jgi:GTPase SAR1 family protein
MEIELKEKYDLLFKFIVIGDSNVGKSCILNYYLNNKCTTIVILLYVVNEHSKHTVGVEFGMRYLKINGKVIKI